MSTSQVHVRMFTYLEGTTIDENTGIITNIYPTDNRPPSKGKRNIIIPVTDNEDIYRTVILEPGSYLIESVLPSGEIVSAEISLESGESERVSMRGESSPREWLSWQQLSGNVYRQSFSPDELRFEATSPLEEELSKGLAEIETGTLREQSFSGEEQWRTLSKMIGREADIQLDEIKGLTHVALAGESQTDGIAWRTSDIYDSQRQVFRLKPNHSSIEIRDFLYWTADGAELIKLPNNWTSPYDLNERVIEVMIDLSQSGKKFRASATVHDSSFATALGYLTTGSLPQAQLLIVDQAQERLYGKVMNPYAATAGGYILLDTDRLAENSDLRQWVKNLYNWFDWLPDGAVLLAWLNLNLGNVATAKSLLKKAYQRGIPLYSLGITRLLNGLTFFSDEDEEYNQMERHVRQVAWRTNMDQYFTIIRLGTK